MIRATEIHRIYAEPELSAREAGLVYLLDDTQGISRTRRGKGFVYFDKDGRRIMGRAHREWIESLAIPPAWEDVWISPSRTTHLLATGRDERGRKQYIYHPKWNELRSLLNFYRLILFAEELPKLRAAIARDVRHKGLPKERVAATALALMDKLSIRIGSDEYARANDTYGITTLENRHAEIRNGVITLHFIGKSHKEREVTLASRPLSVSLRKSKQMSGKRLFQYLDAEGSKHPLTSDDVNEYIQAIAGSDFTAKDFRTWAATAEAFDLMKKSCAEAQLESASQTVRDKKAREIVHAVAQKLGNTAAVCKAHYIHSDLQDIFAKGEFTLRIGGLPRRRPVKGLSASEADLHYFLAVLYREKVASFLS